MAGTGRGDVLVGGQPRLAGEEAEARHSRLRPRIPGEQPVGRRQFIPEQLRGPAEGTEGAVEGPPPPALWGQRRAVMGWGLSKRPSMASTAARGDTCHQEVPSSQGQYWHPQHCSGCPGLSPSPGLRCPSRVAARPQPPLLSFLALALGPAATR